MARSSGRRGKQSGVAVLPAAVRQARVDAGLSMAQLAHPRSRQAIHQIEASKNRPSLPFLRQIAARTGKPLSYFLPQSQAAPAHRELVDRLGGLVATSDFGAAIAAGEAALETDLPREVEADVRFLVGRACVRALDGQRALPHLRRARELYEMVGDWTRLADVLNQAACALYLQDDPRTLAAAYQALEACERLLPAPADLMVRTLIVVGMVLKRLQDWPRAIAVYRRALGEVGAELGIRNLAMLHDHLSQCLGRVGDVPGALEHARRANRLYVASLDPSDLVRADLNLGVTLLRQGELRAARPHLEAALALCGARDLQRQALGEALLAVAELEIASGNFQAGTGYLHRAEVLVDQLGERSHRAAALRLRGRLEIARAEFDHADHAYTAAASLFRELRLPADLLDVEAEHALALEAQGRIGDALAVALRAVAAGQSAIRQVRGGWADDVAAAWDAS